MAAEEETLSGTRVAQLRRWSTEPPAAERKEDTGGEREGAGGGGGGGDRGRGVEGGVSHPSVRGFQIFNQDQKRHKR